jgi:hypothetical protein
MATFKTGDKVQFLSSQIYYDAVVVADDLGNPEDTHYRPLLVVVDFKNGKNSYILTADGRFNKFERVLLRHPPKIVYKLVFGPNRPGSSSNCDPLWTTYKAEGEPEIAVLGHLRGVLQENNTVTDVTFIPKN